MFYLNAAWLLDHLVGPTQNILTQGGIDIRFLLGNLSETSIFHWSGSMQLLKETQRAKVTRNGAGQIVKRFFGPNKQERFRNEVRVLTHLNLAGCDFVPKLIESDEESLCIVTTNAGESVQRMSDSKLVEVFQSLTEYGVRHDDQAVRNVLYDHRSGQFSVIDFEFAELIEPATSPQHALEKLDQLEELIEKELADNQVA